MIDEARIEELVGEIGGTVGICYEDLSSGSTFQLNADESFPAASMIKAPVLWELFRAADQGRVDLSRTMTLSVAMKMEGWGVLKSLSDGLRMSLGDLATLMIVISDNVATDMVLSHLDFASVNASMRELGLTGTELRHSMRGLSAGDAGAAADQPNVTTPADCARLFKAIHSGGVLSQAAHRAMNTILIQQLDKAIIPRYRFKTVSQG